MKLSGFFRKKSCLPLNGLKGQKIEPKWSFFKFHTVNTQIVNTLFSSVNTQILCCKSKCARPVREYDQYLREETISISSFFHEDNKQGKIACETATTAWVWSGVPSHAQACLDVPGMNLVVLRMV